MSKKQFGMVLFAYPMYGGGFCHYTVAVYNFDNQQISIIKDPIYVPAPGVIPDVISFVDYFEEFNLIHARKFKDFPENEVSEEELKAAMIILNFLQKEKDQLKNQVDCPENMVFIPEQTIKLIKEYIDTYIEVHKNGDIYKNIAEQCQNAYERKRKHL